MRYEEFMEFLAYLWSEKTPFQKLAVRHKDIKPFVEDFCKKNNWDDKNWGQQLSHAVKNGDVEKFFYEDGLHSPHPYYRPINTDFEPSEAKLYPNIMTQILNSLSHNKKQDKAQICKTLNQYDQRLVKICLMRLVRERKIKYIPPVKAQYVLENEGLDS